MTEAVQHHIKHIRPDGSGVVIKHRNVQADVILLPDAVKAADALLDQVTVKRQIEQNQVAGKLEVAAFAADFRTQQQLGTLFVVGKISGCAVAAMRAASPKR